MKNTFSLHLTAGLSPQAVLQGGKLRKTQAALECNLIRGLALSTILLWRLIFLVLQETPRLMMTWWLGWARVYRAGKL